MFLLVLLVSLVFLVPLNVLVLRASLISLVPLVFSDSTRVPLD